MQAKAIIVILESDVHVPVVAGLIKTANGGLPGNNIVNGKQLTEIYSTDRISFKLK